MLTAQLLTHGAVAEAAARAESNDARDIAHEAAVADGESSDPRVHELGTLSAGHLLLWRTQVVLVGDVVRLPAVQHPVLLALTETGAGS